MKKVSVVTNCYNVADVIHRCWASLRSQTIGLEHMECIFVDDASTDDGRTLAALQSIKEEAPDSVRIIRSETNGGPGGAMNIGIAQASGEYLQLMNSDDEFVPDALERLYAIASEHRTDIIQFFHILTLGDQQQINNQSAENRLYEIRTPADRRPFLNSTIVTYGCTNKFYRTKLVKDAGVRFAEHMVYEEPLFVYPLFLYANRVYLYKEGLYIYHLHEGSVVTSRLGRQLMDHPRVQLMLLYDCMKRTDLYAEYSDVIACYFLWTYYCETILFAGEQTDAVIPLDVLNEMQRVCLTLYPQWRDNPQIRLVDRETRNLLATMEHRFETQEELNRFIHLSPWKNDRQDPAD
ncbi:MAG: glycosyltransferase [Lachnospiraceae bacterium]|nr:glycosyltransferase [Lachnospiraceae bacterium]